MKHRISHKFQSIIAIIGIGSSCEVISENTEKKTLDSVVISAQKINEKSTDLPISVKTLTDIQEKQIYDLSDVADQVPGIHMTETGISTQVRIRGIGSGNSQGFEQSVVTYVDEVPFVRAQQFRSPYFDIESIEVIRGPQNLLFGKNAVAGAINIITAEPTHKPEKGFSMTYSPQYNQREYSFYASGPLSETVEARIATRFYDDDGYIENTFLDRNEPQKKARDIRGKLNWVVNDRMDISIKAERNIYDVKGKPIEIVQDFPSQLSLDVIASDIGNPDLENIPSTFSNIGNILFDQPLFDGKINQKRQTNTNDYSDNKSQNYNFVARYSFDDALLTSTTGWVNFSYDELCDCEYAPIELFEFALNEDYKQASQEIRIQSTNLSNLKWIGGIYLQNWEQDFKDRFDVPNDGLLSILGNPVAGTSIEREFNQSSYLWSIFGQAKWKISKKFKFTIGARYSEEKKKARKELNLKNLDTQNILEDPLISCAYLDGLSVETVQSEGLPQDCLTTASSDNISRGHSLTETIKEHDFSPAMAIQYNLNPNMMFYVSYSQGFKSGGFDPRSNNSEAFSFTKEKANSFEIGMKNKYRKETAELSLNYFHTIYEDLQVSQFDGAVGFNVGNAKKALVQGIELNNRFIMTKNIISDLSVTWLGFEYKDFTNGNCYLFQQPDGDDTNNDGNPDFCDYTGKTGAFSPKYTINGSLSHNMPFFGKYNLNSSINFKYISKHNIHQSLDPNSIQDSYTLLGGRVAFEADNWNLALIGKNLTDERISTYSVYVPLSGTVFGTNTRHGVIRPPRTVSLQFNYSF